MEKTLFGNYSQLKRNLNLSFQVSRFLSPINSPKQNHKHPHTSPDPLAGWFSPITQNQEIVR
jgi:hypothetical protein